MKAINLLITKLKPANCGRFLQKKPVQKKPIHGELLAVLPVVAIISFVPLSGADQASVTLDVSATVVARTLLRTEYQLSQLRLTQADIARGYFDVAAATRFAVSSNSRSGYVLQFYPVGDAFRSVQIKGLGHTAQLGADGGTVVQRGPVESDTPRELSYRFTLQPGLQPGAYPWPLALSVRSL